MTIGRVLSLSFLLLAFGIGVDAKAQTMASLGPNDQGLSPPGPLSETTTPRPSEPLRRAAFDVLDTHCSRCHQTDRLVNRTKPAKGFGNILDLDVIAANPKYIKPGDADRSLIVHVVVRREMPSDVFQDGDLDHPTPDDNDLKALRAWISSMPKDPKDGAMANARPPIKTGANGPSLQIASLPSAEEHIPLASGPNASSLPSQAPPLTAIETIVEAQKNLRRLGCFKGEADGVRDDKTDAALDLYNSRLGRDTHIASLTPELLEEMGDQSGKICVLTCPVGERYDHGTCMRPETAVRPRAEDQSEAERPALRSRPTLRSPRPRAAERARPEPSAQERPSRPDTREPRAAARREPARPEQKLAVPHRLARATPSAPTFRQAQRQAPAGRGASGGGSSAQDTISGVNGI